VKEVDVDFDVGAFDVDVEDAGDFLLEVVAKS